MVMQNICFVLIASFVEKMQPVNIKKMCRLCLNVINYTNCEVIGEMIREVLEVVLPNLNLEERDRHVMCIACSIKLSAAFNFKSTCMDTEDIISSYVNSSAVSVVDLKEVYLKEKGNIQLTDISENQKICRLCIQLLTCGFVPLNEVGGDIIDEFMPQLKINATKDPVVCESCFDSLRTHGSFIKNCLDAQEKNKNIDKQSHIKTEEIEVKLEPEYFPDQRRDAQEIYKSADKQSEDTKIKLEDGQYMHEKYESGDKQSPIKFEEIEIKVEDDQDGNSPLYDLDNETIANGKDVREIKSEHMFECEAGFNENCRVSMQVHNIQTCNSKKSKFQKCEPSLDMQFHQCDKCKYETKIETDLKTHQLIHEEPSKIQMYKCDMCNFETKRKSNLKGHQLAHKDSSEIQMYKCDTCAYETKYKSHLKVHQIQHKDLLEVRMYTCDTCGFETKYKNCIKSHQLKHKDSSEIEMYTCDTCAYKTKYKSVLNRHRLMHKDPSEIQMYTCDTCPYETKYKSILNRHQLMHKNVTEIQMYKCDACPYETKQMRYLKDHQLKHKDPSEVQMYKCDACSFETKRKRLLKSHQLMHKDLSEIHMYKCDICTYRTKYKSGLNKHQLIHKDTSEIVGV